MFILLVFHETKSCFSPWPRWAPWGGWGLMAFQGGAVGVQVRHWGPFTCWDRQALGHPSASREPWPLGAPGLLGTAFVEIGEAFVDTDIAFP